MRVELTPSAISALRTARARDNDNRRAVDGSSGVPAAYPATLKLVFGPGGAAATNCFMAAALDGLRSDWPAPKVTRNPAPILVAAVAELSEIGGGGGGAAGSVACGGATGARAIVGGAVVGSVAGGAAGTAGAGEAGCVVATVGAVGAGVFSAGWTGAGAGCLGFVVATGRGGFGAVRCRSVGAGFAPGNASRACRSTVTCATAGAAVPSSAVNTRQNCRMTPG